MYILSIVLLKFDKGCIVYDFGGQVFLVAQVMAPIVVIVIFYAIMSLILIISGMRDSWSLRTEVFLLPLYWIPLGIAFIVTRLIVTFDYWPEVSRKIRKSNSNNFVSIFRPMFLVQSSFGWQRLLTYFLHTMFQCLDRL